MPREKVIVTEDDVKKKVIKPWFQKMNGWCFMHVPKGFGVGGIPDYVGCVPIVVTQEMVGKTIGLFVAPEAKRPTNKHNSSTLQKERMKEIDEAGGVTGVVSCVWDMAHMQWRIHRILKGDEK